MISLSDAGKQFSARGKTLRALEPLTLDVARQEFIALVGPSGCGKSTILNLIYHPERHVAAVAECPG